MAKTEDEWRKSITATLTEKRGDRYYTASCPICGDTQTATSIGNDAGKYAVVGKVMTHMRFKHPEMVAADYFSELKKAIVQNFGCDSSHVITTPVKEVFRGEIAWKGDVEVFELVNHPQAKRCYAWGYERDDGKPGWEITTVLEVPPVVSAETAVQAAIVAHAKQAGSRRPGKS